MLDEKMFSERLASAISALGPFADVAALPADHPLLCRFLDAGDKEAPHAELTGVQKAPRHEVAGS
ncbi:hypothetical protein G6321_00051365 [Bradyrhizobium barranii subsp. barranii]|uniref:Uncharacterized protein n=1 Tax=Bradyrhizobium barranii subsp. barranii TaxID=2823807 RepID=A0A7Z0TQ71_9BRAD|nr:hypothetical protein [Bradyrhizobium barranii]UEM13260.1 hypothetical protein J4G43_002610 [Bradyrhizobium barranii subsp. barranii]UGX93880.1 hypothetical protein G6321_00051365 [Bradyrhizobium barranii subsp. barranii]WLB97471.1 hypothetical protein QIH92_49825 [Bradyrhizobium japonicum USDA 123]